MHNDWQIQVCYPKLIPCRNGCNSLGVAEYRSCIATVQHQQAPFRRLKAPKTDCRCEHQESLERALPVLPINRRVTNMKNRFLRRVSQNHAFSFQFFLLSVKCFRLTTEIQITFFHIAKKRKRKLRKSS